MNTNLGASDVTTIPLYNYRIEVLRVIDGDTIVVMVDLGFEQYGREVIRLYDIDTPETRGVNVDPVRGPLATKFTLDWLCADEHDNYTCNDTFITGLTMDSRKYNAREKYGRALADIYRPDDPISLNQALRDAGHQK
jgi:endonuclease YncB( thermonuclease family)